MRYSWRNKIKALILDMDGVLWRGSDPIGNLGAIFERIDRIGWKVVFATNNATRTISQYLDILADFDVRAQPWQVVTSATVAADYLHNTFPDGGPVYIVGERGLLEACESQGFYHSKNDPLAVVASMDRKLTYNKLKNATLFLRKGIPFIGTNPDHTFPTPKGLVPGAGAILAALATACDRIPIIVGKPEPGMYRIALERLRLPPANVLVVGDRPETDIVGAQKIGCRSALVLSGVTNADQANEWQPAPDIISADLETLVHMEW